jgi:hypothetical protein
MLSFGIPVLLILSILSSALVIGREKPAELVFWTAPNKFQNRYNKEIVDTWNRENPDIKIKWTPIPQGESSEEVIFAAIASEPHRICSQMCFPVLRKHWPKIRY